MSNTVAFPNPIPDPAAQRTPAAAASDPRDFANPTPAAANPAADLRLVIEEDAASGTYIYKTMDRRTGEVVQQFPREEVLRLKDALFYKPGQVIDSKS
jgi:flagellar protein FlaG